METRKGSLGLCAGSHVRVIASESRLRSIGAYWTDTALTYRIRKTDPIDEEGLYYLLTNDYWYGDDDLEIVSLKKKESG